MILTFISPTISTPSSFSTLSFKVFPSTSTVLALGAVKLLTIISFVSVILSCLPLISWWDVRNVAPFVRASYERYFEKYKDWGFDFETAQQYAMIDLKKETIVYIDHDSLND